MPSPLLVIACGAIARELVRIRELNGWDHVEFQCLPAELHNTPDKIPEGVRRKIGEARGNYDRILVLYGDCGSGGLLDQLLEEEANHGQVSVERSHHQGSVPERCFVLFDQSLELPDNELHYSDFVVPHCYQKRSFTS